MLQQSNNDTRWNFEKTVVLLRWTLVITTIVCLSFFIYDNPNAVIDTIALTKLAAGALFVSLILHLLLKKMQIDQYHYVSWLYDLVITTLLVSLTGGAYTGSPGPGITANLFLFLYPLLVIVNTVGRTWQTGLMGAFVVNSLLAFLLMKESDAPSQWNLFALLAIINFALGALPILTRQWSDNTMELTEGPIPEPLPAPGILPENQFNDLSEQLIAVTELSEALGNSESLADIYRTVVEHAREKLDSSIAFLVNTGEKNDEIAFSIGMSEITKELILKRLQAKEGFPGDVIQNCAPIRVNVRENKEVENILDDAAEKYKTILMVPLPGDSSKKADGILGVANLTTAEAYTQKQEEILGALAGISAVFLKQMKRKQEIERSCFELIIGLAEAIEAKDSYTKDHVQRVAGYAVSLAKAFQLPQEEVQCIEKAAILHDIGKVTTPEYILTKPGHLTEEEFKLVREHVVESRKMLTRISTGIDERVKEYVGFHHERWDGTGYPEGLKGDEISLGAQIIALADTFDAMTSKRRYRKGLTGEEALNQLMGTAGTQFNPKVLHIFFEMMNFDTNTGKIKPGLKDTIEMKIDNLNRNSEDDDSPHTNRK